MSQNISKPNTQANAPAPSGSATQVPFIDLKSQYKALKNSIDSRIQKVLEHGAYINGPEVVELEKLLTQYTGAKHCLAIASGTDALLVPLMALGIGHLVKNHPENTPKDEVITTAFSFIATAETIVLAGANPVYVDIDPKTYNINTKEIEKAITSKTKAIMPVSLYGQIPNMDEINAIAKKHGLAVIEDAAQSFGASYKGQKSGSISTACGTSFFPAKPLGGYGDGGAIFTSDDNLLKIMKEIREHGSESRYYHTRLGINGRLDSLQCAVLLSKMERYDWELAQRNRIANIYNESLASEVTKNPSKGFQVPYVESYNVSAWAQYSVIVKDRAEFQKKLTEMGVPTSVHYPRTMPDQPWYKEQVQKGQGRIVGDLSFARQAAEQVISLPIFPDMTDAMIEHVIQSVRKALN